ncbi:MAG: toll/interleukin-1 receptor domain-containing protein, partial [Leptolyngbya sp. SIO4C1]|nr:toll/interleukin-1 receptor domain-containing protein [Leptolyngbya sp. SIO4C1]
MSSNIFISYRRADSQNFCNGLSKALTQYFSHLSVFLDEKKDSEETSIVPGSNLDESIFNELNSAKVILVVIGENWLLLDEHSRQRITLDDDWVRKEISYALAREQEHPDEVTVIPIWVGDGSKIKDLIDKASLPQDIKAIADKIQ